MISGTRKKLISFFNEYLFSEEFRSEGELFFLYNDYHSGKEEDPYFFSLDSYLDILSAPYYIIKAANEPLFKYDTNRLDYFTKHFPTPTAFRNSLDNHLSYAINRIQEEVEQIENKKDIIVFLGSTLSNMDIVNNQLNCLKTNENELSNISLEYLKTIYGKTKGILDIIQCTPEELISYRYYLDKPYISWFKDPLAFFRNVFLSSGIDYFKAVQVRNIEQYGDSSSFSEIIEFYFRREYYQTCTIITKNINKLKNRKYNKIEPQIQTYINWFKNQLNALYYCALTTDLKNYYSAPELPFSSIVINLKNSFEIYDWDVNFSCETFYDEPFIFKDEFLNKLLEAALPTTENPSGAELFINKDKVDKQQLNSFLHGSMKDVNFLHFGWEAMQVYYLFYLLERHKATLYFPEGFDKKIYINNEPFTSRSYQTRKSDWKDGKLNFPKHSDKIDELFGM
jgi:hypothetical protein